MASLRLQHNTATPSLAVLATFWTQEHGNLFLNVMAIAVSTPASPQKRDVSSTPGDLQWGHGCEAVEMAGPSSLLALHTCRVLCEQYEPPLLFSLKTMLSSSISYVRWFT